MLLISFWLVLVFLVAFLSLKQAKNDGEFCATLGNRFPSQSRDARKKNREGIPTWSNFAWLCEIQKESSCRTNLEHFLESIVYMLYIVLKLRKLKVQRFKQCANQSWNEEVMVIWRQLHQSRGSFRKLAKLRKMNFVSLAKPKLRKINFAPCAKFSQALQNLPV